MSNFLRIVYDFFKGMSSFIAPEKLPKTVLQVIENYDLMLQYGNLKKRRGFLELIEDDLTALIAMVDWVDKNGGRQLLLLDSTTLKESVYSTGAYGAVSAIAHDERASATTGMIYPIVHNREVRSPAGAYNPFIFQYRAAVSRFPNSGTPVAIAAGKYLDYSSFVTPLINGTNGLIALDRSGPGVCDSEVTDIGIAAETKILFYFAPVYDGYIKGMPELYTAGSAYSALGENTGAIIMKLAISDSPTNDYKRITDIDVFVSEINIANYKGSPENYPAYFLERIPLDGDGDPILHFDSTQVTLDDTLAAEKITIANYADWLTGFYNSDLNILDHLTLHDITNGVYYRITGVAKNGTDVDLTTDPVCADSGAAEVEILSRWYTYDHCYLYPFFYDNFHKKKRTEMYTYLNIPTGDTGLSSYVHKYAVIANNRYFGFGFADGNAYFSPEYAFDVLPSQNIIRPVKDVVGCARSGRDVYMFYKTGGSRITVLSNMNIDQDDDFSDVGSCGQGSICQIDEDTFAFLSYKGPYMVQGRQKKYIGQDIITWFVKTGSLPLFSDAEKEACVADYHHNKRQVIFSFPGYSTAPYTSGISFVFHIDAYEMGFNPWTILKSTYQLISFTRTNDNHLLGANGTTILDFDGATQGETVATRLLFNLLRVNKRARMLFHKLYVDITTDDTITMNAYFDGSSSATALTALNDDNETNIKQIKQSMELEITTVASTNDVEVSGIELKVLPRKF